MKYAIPYALALVSSLAACQPAPFSRADSIRVLVLDESGGPIPAASVRGFFFQEQIVDGRQSETHAGVTNGDGVVELYGREQLSVDVLVTKSGYYNSSTRALVRSGERQKTVQLRPRHNPIEMFAKSIVVNEIAAEVGAEEFGYDLMVGDFVDPHGAGVVADLLLTNQMVQSDFWTYDWTMTIRFSNPDDGLVPFYLNDTESEFKSDYLAPSAGYKAEWTVRERRQGRGTSPIGNRDRLRNYYFRVRSSIVDGTVSAHYGKIYGEFPYIEYYLNPNLNDRNVEADVSRNLLDVSDYQKVTRP